MQSDYQYFFKSEEEEEQEEEQEEKRLVEIELQNAEEADRAVEVKNKV